MSITTTRQSTLYTRYEKRVPTAKLPTPSTSTFNTVFSQVDSRTSNLRRKPKPLALNPSSYSRTIYSNWGTITVYGHLKQVADSQLYLVSDHVGEFGGGGSVYRAIPLPPGSLEQAALVKARLKLKDQDVNIGQALAERKLTADLVSSSLLKIARSARALRRGRLQQAARELGVSKRLYKDASFFNNWLELQYGWKPLLSDIHGSVTALSDKEVARDGLAIVTVKATARDNLVLSRSFSQPAGDRAFVYRFNEREEYLTSVSLTFTKSNPALASAAQLGLTNPAQIAWELVPFSFVVDWALPIGDFLSQLDASFGWSFNTGTLSRVTRCRRDGFNFSVTNTSNALVEAFGYCSSPGRAFRFSRSVYGSEPVATVPQPKSFDKILSFAHVENAIALLAQAFV